VAGCYEHGTKPPGCIKGGGFRSKLFLVCVCVCVVTAEGLNYNFKPTIQCNISIGI
jgi:hypothetical protein